MEFDQPRGIYLQIADQVCERIVHGEWAAGERIPSIRELAVTLGVNPNTITRSYQVLVEQQIIENQRGLGYNVTARGRDRILKQQRAVFVREELPRLFQKMQLLEIGMDELAEHHQSFNGGQP